MPIDYNRFPADVHDAEERTAKWQRIDPFPMIDAALLNSADLEDYARITAFIYPFDPGKLKQASYPLTLGGEILTWDREKKQKHTKQLPIGAQVTLRRNSITYVTTQEYFRLPDYLALRFNLIRKHVHQGMLLGTGPLIDPGFYGCIMIPIHNLTSNDYVLEVGRKFIYFEATKLSRNGIWNPDPGDNLLLTEIALLCRSGTYRRNDSLSGSNTSMDEYMKQAIGNKDSVVSGFESEFKTLSDDTRAFTTESKEKTERFTKEAKFISVALFLSLIAIVVTLYTFACNAVNSIKDSYKQNVESKFDGMKASLDAIQKSNLDSIKKADLDALNRRLEALERLAVSPVSGGVASPSATMPNVTSTTATIQNQRGARSGSRR